MNFRRFSYFIGVISILLPIYFTSCSFGNEGSSSKSSSKGGEKYGSLTVVTGSSSASSRQLDVSVIDAADVSVTGKGISASVADTLKKTNVEITGGKLKVGEPVQIDNIPVGKNRVVTVQAKTTINSVLQGMAGVTMTAVTDIETGNNEATVNWASSKVGNVFAALLASNYERIADLSPATVESYLPSDTHAALINASKIASDIIAGTARADKAETYKLTAGTLTFESDVSSSSIVLQICDPASSKLTSVSSGTNTITNVAPGTWKVFGIVNGTTVVYADSVTIEAGETTVIPGGAIQFKTPKPRLENASGAQISEFISSTTTVYLKARTLDGEDEPEGVAIYYTKTTDGSEPAAPTASSTLYDAENGISVTSGTKIKAIAICLGLLNSEVSSWTFPALGFTHPESGMYSPVDMNGAASGFGWASGTWTLGATVSGEETTFALYSANATKILLEIYGAPYGENALYDYWMEKGEGNVWRAKLSGDLTGAIYAFRCWGPNWPFSESWTRGGSNAGYIGDYDSYGNRFNPNKVVYDPYAREMTHDASNADAIAAYKTEKAAYKLTKPEYQILSSGQPYENNSPVAGGTVWREYDSGTIAPKGYVITDAPYSGVKPGISASQARIYEAHVRGITQHPSSSNLSSILSGIDGFEDVADVPAEYRGTYKGATYIAPYLKALGINTIELLPVHETDNDANPDDGAGGNYWGYMTFGYFAPDRRYSYDKTAGGPTREFKEMVDAFHNEGIEVYLDVVYNHSGEGGNWNGSTTKWDSDKQKNVTNDNYDEGKQCTVVSMRGIDNQTYYSLVTDKTWSYWDTTGCGNNLQCDNSVVRQFIIDSLSYWISDMGVDGFRFDLAPVLGREGKGTWNFSSSATTLIQIASLGASNSVEMIAEAWDCQWPGGYQIGHFPTGWGDWNGVYRDVVRKYVGGAGTTETKSDNGNVLYNLNIGNALYGSSDIFVSYRPSVNMIVAHDGFTLADLSSYAGAGNAKNNNAWPFGPSDGGNGDTNYIVYDTQAGHRQINRNYIALQMVTRGIPMIVWGDEFSRTQNGNNNPYNIDSVATWNNYNMINTKSPQAVATGGLGTYTDKFGTFDNTTGRNGNFIFMKRMLKMHSDPAFTQSSYSSPALTYQDGGDSSDFTFGYKIAGSAISGGHDFYFFSNMTSGQVTVTIPAPASGYHWVRICDTGAWAEPNENSWDIDDTEAEDYYEITTSTKYGVGAWTVLILQQVSDGPVLPTCATPSISGDTPFETSTSVSITCETTGALIYYTTDGSTPTASSSLYTGALNLTETTTVKAIALCDGYKKSAVASKKFTLRGNVIDSSKSGVMLQGFNWDSAPRGNGYNAENPSPYWGRWYNVVTNNASAISDTFDYLWCPPPSMTDTASSEGYAPTQLNNLNNCYGTETELKAMINAISPTKAIADIVINHRGGTTCWGDFTNPDWGVVKESNYQAICSDDEGFIGYYENGVHKDGDSHMTGVPSNMRGAADTGDGYSAYRDLDHTNTSVQQGIIDWMNNVLKPAGFVGWRYDYVKGYGGKYVGKYNAQTEAEFSVGEYWPTDSYSASGWGPAIKNWISATESEGGQRSRAFDFALKGAMNSVFNNGGSYAQLADSSNLYISQPSDAVTFVDNHDTGSTQGHWPVTSNKVGAAYALILTHPGYPCVAWQHYFTYAESGSTGTDGGAQYLAGNTVAGTSNTLRQHIDELIQIRKDLGIEYDSVRTTLSSTSSVYAAKIVGQNGTLVVVIGGSYTPDGDYGRIYKGTNFTIWQEGAEDVYGGGGGSSTVTLSATKDVGSGNAVYFAGTFEEASNWTYVVRGTWNTGNVWTADVTVPSSGSFEWKALQYTYSSETTISQPTSGATWESGGNHTYPSTVSTSF